MGETGDVSIICDDEAWKREEEYRGGGLWFWGARRFIWALAGPVHLTHTLLARMLEAVVKANKNSRPTAVFRWLLAAYAGRPGVIHHGCAGCKAQP